MSLPQFLYHYTQIETMSKIFIGDGKVNLRLTDIHFLNDLDEGSYFLDFIKNQKDLLLNEFSNEEERKYCSDCIADFLTVENPITRTEMLNRIYTMSFTTQRDSMQFWRQSYANNKGICLVLETEKYQKFRSQTKLFDLQKVLYLDECNYKENLSTFIEKIKIHVKKFHPEELNDCVATEQLKNIRHFIVKNTVWANEDEYRICAFGPNFISKCFRQANENVSEIDDLGIPRYFVEMDNPFTEVILGPDFSDYYIRSISQWFSEKGYKNIKVSKSTGHCR